MKELKSKLIRSIVRILRFYLTTIMKITTSEKFIQHFFVFHDYLGGFDHASDPSSIDMKSVRLCFQVFLKSSDEDKYNIRLAPIVSEPVHNKMCDLKIVKLSKPSCSVSGGEDIILLCEKVFEVTMFFSNVIFHMKFNMIVMFSNGKRWLKMTLKFGFSRKKTVSLFGKTLDIFNKLMFIKESQSVFELQSTKPAILKNL